MTPLMLYLIPCALGALGVVGYVCFRLGRRFAAVDRPHPPNGKSRPTFRFILTMTALIMYGSTIAILVIYEPDLSVAAAALFGTAMTGLSTILTLAFKWFFDRMDTDETQDTTDAPPTQPQQRTLPHDY